MAMNLFEHLKFLHDSELFQDLKQLSCIAISLCENNTTTEVLSLSHKYQCMVYYGNALYQLGEFCKAENIYKKALLLKKTLNKTKGKGNTVPGQHSQYIGNLKCKECSTGLLMEVTSEVDVKYKLYQCLSQLKLFREGMSILEGISSKQRSAKVNLALAKMYVMAGMDRSAITSYKEVIRECPFSMESIQGLLSLGVKGADVAALVMNGLPHGTSCDWLTTWIKGEAFMANREYGNAIITFKQMDQKMCLKDNVYVVNSIAKGRFYEGNDTAALLGFQRVHALDPLFLKNMDLYSYLLAKEKRIPELQRLSEQLMKVSDKAPESWISMGYFSLISRKVARTRTVYFAQKASIIDPYNVEAYLLKGTALYELKKSQDASLHFQEALRHAPHRYEAYHGLISCYLSQHRNREALACAGKAIKTIGSNPRTLTIYASVLTNEPNMYTKAKPYLEKAMKLDPSYLEPVYVMAEILYRDHQYDKGIEMLRRQLQTHNTCRLHQLLGDFLSQVNENLEALDEYSIALSLDPNNSRAREGKERVEKHNDVGLESTYDLEGMESSENDGEFDGSDVESNWSETEFS